MNLDKEFQIHIRTYTEMADTYHINAIQMAGKREYRKATELLWGAITQRIKAVAALHNHTIENHGRFFDFVRQLAKEREDEELYTDFLDLNALHRNFYDQIIPDKDFDVYLKRAIVFEKKMQQMLEDEIKKKESNVAPAPDK